MSKDLGMEFSNKLCAITSNQKPIMIDKEIESIIPILFPNPKDVDYVTHELNKLARTFKERDESFSRRLQAAIIRCSEGNTQKLDQAIFMTKFDWRDTLVNAGFGIDINKHEIWIDEQQQKK